MRLNVKGLLLKLGGDKTEVARRAIKSDIDASAMARRKQQLRLQRWLLHHKRSRDNRIVAIVGAALGLVAFPILMFVAHFFAPRGYNPLAAFIAIPIIACGLVTLWMLIRDLRRVDKEAARIKQRQQHAH